MRAGLIWLRGHCKQGGDPVSRASRALQLTAHPEEEPDADGLSKMKSLYDGYKSGRSDRAKETWKEMMKRATTADALGKVMRLFGPEEKGVLMLDEAPTPAALNPHAEHTP